MLNASVLFICVTNVSQVLPHSAAGYATVATTGDSIKRLVGVNSKHPLIKLMVLSILPSIVHYCIDKLGCLLDY